MELAGSQPSSRFSERFCLRGPTCKVIEKDTPHPPSASVSIWVCAPDTCEHIQHTRTHTHTHTHRTENPTVSEVSKSLAERQICAGGKVSNGIKCFQVTVLGMREFSGCVYWKVLHPLVVHPGVFSHQEMWLLNNTMAYYCLASGFTLPLYGFL